MAQESFMDLLQKICPEKDFSRMMAFTAGMQPERRAVMLKFIAERETLAPAVGTEAPDFKLPGSTAARRCNSRRCADKSRSLLSSAATPDLPSVPRLGTSRNFIADSEIGLNSSSSTFERRTRLTNGKWNQ